MFNMFLFLQQMWDQEKKHLAKFNEILAENRVRPTALLPFWNIAGFVLGWYSLIAHSENHLLVYSKDELKCSVAFLVCFLRPPGASSALLGKEGAMACTVAVEESISEHYNSQIRALMEDDPERYLELLQVTKCFQNFLIDAL